MRSLSKRGKLLAICMVCLAVLTGVLLCSATSVPAKAAATVGVNLGFDDMADGAVSHEQINVMDPKGGATATVAAAPDNSANKALKLSTTIAESNTTGSLWFNSKANLALGAQDRYDVLSADVYIPAWDNGGMSLNDYLYFRLDVPDVTQTVYMRGSGMHISVVKATGDWLPGATSLKVHGKWFNIKMVLDYSDYTYDLIYTFEGASKKFVDGGALPEAWAAAKSHVLNYRVGASFTHYTGNASSYIGERSVYIDNMQIYSMSDADTVDSAATDHTTADVGDTVTAAAYAADGEVSPITPALQWYRSTTAAGTAFTAIDGATAASYTAVDADKGLQLKAVMNVEADGMVIQTIETNPVYVAPVLWEDDFSGFTADTALENGKPYTVNEHPVNIKSDPAGTQENVAQFTPGSLLQRNIAYLKGCDVYSAVDYYVADNFTGTIQMQLFNATAKKDNVSYRLRGGYVQVSPDNVNTVKYPVGEWFTLAMTIRDYNSADMYMIKGGVVTLVKKNFKPFADANVAFFRSSGITMARVGTLTTNAGDVYIDNISFRHAMDEKLTENVKIVSDGGDTDFVYGYDAATTRKFSATGIDAETQELVLHNASLVNAGKHAVVAAVTQKNAASGYSPVLYVTQEVTINQASYDMTGVLFEDKTVDWQKGQNQTIEVSGTLPDGVEVSYTCGGEAFTGTTVGGVFEVTAVFASTNPNYAAPASMTATLTVNQSSYDMSGVTFADKAVTYDGNSQTIAVGGTLPDGVTVEYYNGQDKFVGATDAGEYTVTAKFTGSEDFMPIPDMTAKLTVKQAAYDMSGVTFADKTVTYDGSSQTIAVGGTLPDGVTVEYYNGQDKFVGVTNAGKYTVTAKFTTTNKNYAAPADKTAVLEIKKADYDMSGITFADKNVDYNSLTQTIAISGTLPANVGVAYECNGEKFVGVIAPGEYTVKAIFTSTDANYADPAAMTAKLTIVQKAYDMSGITFSGATVTYDGSPKSIAVVGTLPEGVEVQYVNNAKTSAGTYTVTAKFTGDPDYADIPDMVATLTIEKADVDMSGVKFEDLSVEYDGKSHSILVTGLPEGVTVTYENNGQSSAGEYTVTAKFTVENANYNAIADMTAKLTIQAAATEDKGCKSFTGGTFGPGALALLAACGLCLYARRVKKAKK